MADTATMAGGPFAAVELLAPEPASLEQATVEVWARHYCATALAAHATVSAILANRKPAGEGASPSAEIVCINAVGVYATAAACALLTPRAQLGERLWRLTPDAGGEDGDGDSIFWLAVHLNRMGINPADIYPQFDATYFTSPTQVGSHG